MTNSSIQTYTGKSFDLLNINPDLIDIEDIAHALSMQCRFNGHIREFYSVAQHCVLVAQYLKHALFGRNVIMAGLLHDAAEAYLGDVVSPLKRVMNGDYSNLEKQLQDAIYARYNVDLNNLTVENVKLVDEMMLFNEKFYLFGHALVWPSEYHVPAITEIHGWDSATAEKEFLNLFKIYSN